MKYSQTTWKLFSEQKIHSAHNLVSILIESRESEKTVALINGSFDLLHAGHLHILYEASKTADILVVALNSDESVKRYKGKKRPIVNLKYRMELISALAFVDYVTWFEEDDPRQIIRLIRPDVHVNGSEYGPECIEALTVKECGGRLHVVDRIPGLATSSIITAIQDLSGTSSCASIKTII